MTLSNDLKERLYRHLREEDTVQQKLEFRKLLRENQELAQTYYELRTVSVADSFAAYPDQLLASIEAAKAGVSESPTLVTEESAPPVVVPPVAEPTTVRQTWLDRLTKQLNQWTDGLALPNLQGAFPQLMLVRVAFGLILVVGLGWGLNSWWLTNQESNLLIQYANAYGPSQGSADADACPMGLNGVADLYTYHADNSFKMNERISAIQQMQGITSECRAYFLGRAYLGRGEYDQAGSYFKAAQATRIPKLQEMATFDLALTYLLRGEKQKGLTVLESRSVWSEPSVVDALKAEVE